MVKIGLYKNHKYLQIKKTMLKNEGKQKELGKVCFQWKYLTTCIKKKKKSLTSL